MIDLNKYVLAGRAVFALSDDEGYRCTYKVSQDSKYPRRFFIGVLYGPDNTSDYRYMGLFYDDSFKLRITKASLYPDNDKRCNLFKWLLIALENDEPLMSGIHLHPSCRCARCGRLLTTPDSIACGLGPECRNL